VKSPAHLYERGRPVHQLAPICLVDGVAQSLLLLGRKRRCDEIDDALKHVHPLLGRKAPYLVEDLLRARHGLILQCDGGNYPRPYRPHHRARLFPPGTTISVSAGTNPATVPCAGTRSGHRAIISVGSQ
jgi:hypothetical protein